MFILGCGFFPEGFFVSGSRKQEHDVMQVRIVAPTIGLAKGLLLRKKGIDRIQLPRSMIKAMRSQTCKDNWAAVIIKNQFPSKENTQMGRYIDPGTNASEWWMNENKKNLSAMYQRIFKGFGVEQAIIDKYAKGATKPKKLRHGKHTK